MAVTPTSAAVNRLKRYVSPATDPTLTDNEVTEVLTDWAVVDENGTVPDGNWGTFDFYGAAAECWRLKAGRAGILVNTSGDNQRFDLSQIREACNEQVAYFENLRMTGSVGVDGLDTY